MAKNRETRERVEDERALRARLAVPVTAGGVLYLLGAITLYQSLLHLPTVGILQGLAPALAGKAGSAVSPQAPEVRFLSHHAFGLIAGSALQAGALVALLMLLVFLSDATQARSGEASRTPRTLVLIGGGASAIVVVAGQVVRAINTHSFVTGHDLSQHAVERAVTTGAANALAGYLGLLAPVVLVVGMVMVLLRATRVGLIPRWLRAFGIVAAILMLPLFAQAFTLQIIPAAWMVATGFMLMGRLPGGHPPAWESGESIPWPAPAGRRQAAGSNGAGARRGGRLSEASAR
ncbi:MAG: hypothetical protein KGJ43_02475 [Acidobacteriota bacterium]|nr:hypothetical protein [Acidobacteriota bacterium]